MKYGTAKTFDRTMSIKIKEHCKDMCKNTVDIKNFNTSIKDAYLKPTHI